MNYVVTLLTQMQKLPEVNNSLYNFPNSDSTGELMLRDILEVIVEWLGLWGEEDTVQQIRDCF